MFQDEYKHFQRDAFAFTGTPSSSEEEREDRNPRRDPPRFSFKTPTFGKGSNNNNNNKSTPDTPSTVTQLTPSPAGSSASTASSPIQVHVLDTPVSLAVGGLSRPSRHLQSRSAINFVDVQKGFLDHYTPATNTSTTATALFRDGTTLAPTSRRKSRSSRKSRLSQSLLLHGYESPLNNYNNNNNNNNIIISNSINNNSNNNIRRNPSHRSTGSFGNRSLPSFSSQDFSSESSPDTSPRPRRTSSQHGGATSPLSMESASTARMMMMKNRGKTVFYVWSFLLLSVMSTLLMIAATQAAVKPERTYEATHPEFHFGSAAGLRGPMTSGHWEEHHYNSANHPDHHSKHGGDLDHNSAFVLPHPHRSTKTKHHHGHKNKEPSSIKAEIAKHYDDETEFIHTGNNPFRVQLPPPLAKLPSKTWDWQDANLYSQHRSSETIRVFALDPTTAIGSSSMPARPHKLRLYPADFTDNTQLYSVLESTDERLGHMEIRDPYTQGECVPMQDWQTTFHPLCNGMHEVAMDALGDETNGNDINLFGTKGFWRYAWKLDVDNLDERDTVVLKTLKYEHNFEDAHFEHDRVDAVAMERLTSSPHVINVFGFCGHSVVTEYADGSRVGELADKSKKKPLARLKIARDIANGLADVHGIDGDDNATFVHLDVNPANVVSVGGTLKLNDFNIGIIRRWNTTSNTPCGFPAQYPNPQWRSPEEARNEQDLTEKVDVFSMGHIFFRLICGHEPWNKLEPGGRPTKEEVNLKVQRGDLPFVPDEVRHSEDPEVMAIYKAMKACYTFDPAKRPSAREISKTLEKTLVSLEKKKTKGLVPS